MEQSKVRNHWALCRFVPLFHLFSNLEIERVVVVAIDNEKACTSVFGTAKGAVFDGTPGTVAQAREIVAL